MKTNEVAIVVDGIYKQFKLPHDKKNSLKQTILSFRKRDFEIQKVLNNINFEIQKGEFFGILGRNGSGKSTLLKLMAGIYEPTNGSISINGTLTPFIELGIRFNPELSGKDNVFLNGAILGLTKKEINSKYEEIVKFAELENFMDQKLRNYSSGMLVRLSFAIAIQAHNDILLIDEVLAVGDMNFQQKCLDVFRNLKRNGKTVVLVTHDMGAVEEFCDRAILIDKGDIVFEGMPIEVTSKYRKLNYEDAGSAEPKEENETRIGTGEARIEYALVNDGKPILNDRLKIKTKVIFKEKIDDAVIGISISDMLGNKLLGTNTIFSQYKKRNFQKNETVLLEWDLDNILKTGKYSLNVAVHDYGGKPYDWFEGMVKFSVQRKKEISTLVDVDIKVKTFIEK